MDAFHKLEENADIQLIILDDDAEEGWHLGSEGAAGTEQSDPDL